MTLPKSEIETGFDIVSGFGFDQSTDRYKVIRMLYVTVKDDPTTTNGTVSFRMEGEITPLEEVGNGEGSERYRTHFERESRRRI